MAIQSIILKPETPHVYGATLAQQHIGRIKAQIRVAICEDTLVMLDLSKVLSVTPSYLKATLLWALQCGQMDARQQIAAKTSDAGVRPLKLFPVVTGCRADVAVDVHEFFSGRSLPLLHVTKRRAERILAAQILGTLDPLLFRTLSALVEKRAATAAELAAESNESISVNGWNNRLADLHVLRLVWRQRQGKFWIYSPLAEGITLWA